MNMMKTRMIVLPSLGVALLVVGGLLGYHMASLRKDSADMKDANASTASTAEEKKVLYWYDPMVPNQHFDKSGKSPFMDMQLVAKYADDDGSAVGVKIDPGILQNLGVRLTNVESGLLPSSLEAVGTVQWNTRQMAVVQTRSAGFVERSYARAVGDIIEQDAPLADLLVPEWAGAQAEFLAVRQTGDSSLIQATRERLKLSGMPARLIAEVERIGKPQPVFTVTAPIAGVIQSLDVRTGMSLAAGMPLASINGVNPVWLEVAVPEAQAGAVSVGNKVQASLTAFPDAVVNGTVIAVLPETNADNRSVQLRVELPNADGRLKAGMFARIRLATDSNAPALLVPSEAVIRTGTRNVVLLAMDNGRFQPVEVTLGREGNGKVVVLGGLSEGQRIVASGQFLIDSEANLKGVVTRLSGSTP